ncbi:hypothetical protein FOA52_013709 [Chlamydomonas sp. UWO 241]|nr:hypothetical protein FOA52_013709 [Chlamydomonas sp. UWO 241]
MSVNGDAPPACQQHRGFATASSGPCDAATPSGGGSAGGGKEPLTMSLQEAVMSLADVAVSKVEEGDLDAAIGVLSEGIKEFGPRFPDSPEVGELHNQVALLLFMKGDVEEAAGHAQTALDATSAAFGPTSVLTGHRQLRMGAVRVGQGKHNEAAGMLQDAVTALGDDPSKAEAQLYLALVQLSRASDVTHVTALDGELFRCVRVMRDNFGVDSMVLRLALMQHDKLVTRALGAQVLDASLCEALMAQHVSLLEFVDPSGEELAIALYKIATFFYTQDLLSDAGKKVALAGALLKGHYHEDHPLVLMCSHRMGMVCAASGDHRAATKLLSASLKRYQSPDQGGAEGTASALAKEAELGLAMARFRSIDQQLPKQQLQERQAGALAEVHGLLSELVKAIGSSHMLAQAGMRYCAQLGAFASPHARGSAAPPCRVVAPSTPSTLFTPGAPTPSTPPTPGSTDTVGVLLLNLGGPDKLDDVQPFLYNLFADPEIIRLPEPLQFLQPVVATIISTLRAPKSKEGYAAIGGGSPLRRITEDQGAALAASLGNKGLPGAKVYVGMRYWHPYTEEALAAIKADGVGRLVILPLYPQFSISTSGSSFRLLEQLLKDDPAMSRLKHTVIPSWYQRKGYVGAMVDLMVEELTKFEAPADVEVFFSAHGVPVSYVEKAGDPYKEEMEECVSLIMDELRRRGCKNRHTLAYQSRVGPVEWLKPYTDDTIRLLGKRGTRAMLTVPISFVSEHIETLEEIDVEYRELAHESGIKQWGRVPALNTNARFIDDLADAVVEALPYVGQLAGGSIDALVPGGELGALLDTFDKQRMAVPSPVPMWEWGWTDSAEILNGRLAMVAILFVFTLETVTGQGIIASFFSDWRV